LRNDDGWALQSTEPNGNHNLTINHIESGQQTAPLNHMLQTEHDLESLGGSFNTITIRAGDGSSMLMRQASHWQWVQLSHSTDNEHSFAPAFLEAAPILVANGKPWKFDATKRISRTVDFGQFYG
jgi:hypothetical protein